MQKQKLAREHKGDSYQSWNHRPIQPLLLSGYVLFFFSCLYYVMSFTVFHDMRFVGVTLHEK